MPKKIKTKPFGTIDVEERQILHFPGGLLGFEEFHEFALIEENAESPFKWLQSTQESGLAFICIQPEIFLQNYRPLIAEEELVEIGLGQGEEMITFLVVTIPHDDPKGMTANLQGPILINPKTRLGKQFISKDENHPIRKGILESFEEASSQRV